MQQAMKVDPRFAKPEGPAGQMSKKPYNASSEALSGNANEHKRHGPGASEVSGAVPPTSAG